MSDVWTSRVVAGAVFLILIALILVLCFVEIPKANHDIVVTLAGGAAGSAGAIVSFYFGSSSSSRDKDETLKRLATGDGQSGGGA
jgi:hypothetical protein